jgi:hypothetical protein
MALVEISPEFYSQYNQRLKEFEKIFQYPLGTNTFFIDHGADYFAFFKRLGTPYVFVEEENNKILAIAVIILRYIDRSGSGSLQPIWYICDLKVHPEYRGHYFLQQVLEKAYALYSRLSVSVYGISMNTASRSNRLLSLATRMPLLNLKFSEILNFYFIEMNVFKTVFPDWKDLQVCSLKGIKDLVLNTSKKPMDFYHLSRRAESLDFSIKNIESGKIMFCVPTQDIFVSKLDEAGIKEFSTASVISNLNDIKWSFIESKDI